MPNQAFSQSPLCVLLRKAKNAMSLRKLFFGHVTMDINVVSMLNKARNLSMLWITAKNFSRIPDGERFRLRLPALKLLHFGNESGTALDMEDIGVMNCVSGVLAQLEMFHTFDFNLSKGTVARLRYFDSTSGSAKILKFHNSALSLLNIPNMDVVRVSGSAESFMRDQNAWLQGLEGYLSPLMEKEVYAGVTSECLDAERDCDHIVFFQFFVGDSADENGGINRRVEVRWKTLEENAIHWCGESTLYIADGYASSESEFKGTLMVVVRRLVLALIAYGKFVVASGKLAKSQPNHHFSVILKHMKDI